MEGEVKYMYVKINSIKSQYLLADYQFEYILENVGKPLPLEGINFYPNGEVFFISIYDPEGDLIILFEQNEYEFSLCQD